MVEVFAVKVVCGPSLWRLAGICVPVRSGAPHHLERAHLPCPAKFSAGDYPALSYKFTGQISGSPVPESRVPEGSRAPTAASC
jgi:hypothetical protein